MEKKREQIKWKQERIYRASCVNIQPVTSRGPGTRVQSPDMDFQVNFR